MTPVQEENSSSERPWPPCVAFGRVIAGLLCVVVVVQFYMLHATCPRKHDQDYHVLRDGQPAHAGYDDAAGRVPPLPTLDIAPATKSKGCPHCGVSDHELMPATSSDPERCCSKFVRDTVCTTPNNGLCFLKNSVEIKYWDEAYKTGRRTIPTCDPSKVAGYRTAPAHRQLLVFNSPRIFNQVHFFHTFNNFLVEIPPWDLNRTSLHCLQGRWNFAGTLEAVLGLNSRYSPPGVCYRSFLFSNEYFAVYSPVDPGIAARWSAWRTYLRSLVCTDRPVCRRRHRLQAGVPLLTSAGYDVHDHDRARGHACQPGQKVVIRREGAQNRQLKGCDWSKVDADHVFTPHHKDEAMNLELLCRTVTLIGAHGDGLSNLFFMPPGSKVCSTCFVHVC